MSALYLALLSSQLAKLGELCLVYASKNPLNILDNGEFDEHNRLLQVSSLADNSVYKQTCPGKFRMLEEILSFLVRSSVSNFL